MFFHDLKYMLLSGFRVKSFLFWLMLFPILLGTLFKVAFGNVYENDVLFRSVPTAVVETESDPVFHQVIDSLEEADEPLLDVEYTDEENAMKLLKEGKISGIIYVGDKLLLSVTEQKMEQVILKTFVEQYSVNEKVIKDTAEKDPSKIQAVVDKLSEDVSACRDIPMTHGDPDIYVQYFYNLIAMVAMYGSVTGLHVTVHNQANLSALGARKNCSPTPKSVSLLADLAGSYIMQSACMILCVTFTHFVLKIDFGDRLPLVYVAAILGGILGVSFGFFFGAVNRFSFEAKIGIVMAVSMFSCFLSGLMMGQMKGIIAEHMPWFNKINPATVVADSLFSLNMYSDYSRFISRITTMLIITAVCTAAGIIISRRKKYADL
ncbi:MAG TPA: ABC transporter permease [Ruminococcus flavefaciens]|nr:ABC transporter permease [Ruminococcus flavefaciens]HQM02382.1 ABC transporter permease [Ruminococcus flavefaciens]